MDRSLALVCIDMYMHVVVYVCYYIVKIQLVDYCYISGERFLLTPGKCGFGYSFV